MPDYIGLDIGGTNIRVGAIDADEKIIYSYKELTFSGVNNENDLYNKIKRLVELVPNYNNAKKIGISVAGSVDLKSNNIITSKNLNMLINYPLKNKLEKDYNKEVIIENDAKVIGLAESIKGVGKNYNIVCYITISTGCGGSIVMNKQIYHGSNNLGGYLPRIILDGKNTVDNLLSGRAFLLKAQKELNDDINEPKEVFELYKKGDLKAKKIIEEFKNNLVVLLLNVSATINPDIFILGGGMIKDADMFLDDVINSYYNLVHPLAKDTIIKTSSLDDAGILGACLLAKK